MGIKIYIPVLLMALSLSASAEIFKCLLTSGKIIYQLTPCPPTTQIQHVISVKEPDPKTEAESEAKFKDWQKELTLKEAAEAEAEKQRKIERNRQESLELQRRSAIAQEQQAIATQQRQEQANRGIITPLYNGFPWGNGYRPYDDDHNYPHHDRSPSPMGPPSQNLPSQTWDHASKLISPNDKKP